MILPFLLFCLLCTSCSDSTSSSLKEWMTQNGKLKVLSTTAMIEDLVRQVGDEYVDSTVLIKGDLDPHSYQLVKGDDEKIAFSDLIFYNGLGLEHGPSLQNALSENAKAIPLGELIRQTSPTLILLYKGQLDPHLWMDVSIWAQAIPHIVKALSQKDQARAAIYQKNGEELQRKMEAAHLEIKEKLHAVPASKRYLVTSHDAFNYFARAYLSDEKEGENEWKERFVAPEGLAPESQISSSDIQSVIDHLEKYKVRILFPESNVNRDSIRKIVQAANEKKIVVSIAPTPLYADAMGKTGSDADTYLKMMQHNAISISNSLHFNGE